MISCCSGSFSLQGWLIVPIVLASGKSLVETSPWHEARIALGED